MQRHLGHVANEERFHVSGHSFWAGVKDARFQVELIVWHIEMRTCSE